MKIMKTQLLNFIICLSFIFCSTTTFSQWQFLGEQKFSSGIALGGFDFTISDGTPYIIYSDVIDNNSVNVMKYDGNDWVYIGAESFPLGRISFPSIAVNDGIVYISYRDNDFDLKASVMKYDGSSWTYVGERGFSTAEARFPSIAFFDGELYVAFEDETYSVESSVMKYDGSDWVYVGDPGFTSSVSTGQSIYNKLIIEEGELYLVFMSIDITQQETQLMKLDGDNWISVVDSGIPNSVPARQFLDFYNGEPYCAILEPNILRMSVKRYKGNEWVNVGMPGFSAGLAASTQVIIHKGVPYAAFRDYTVEDRLTVMYFDGNDWLPLGGSIGVSPAGAIKPLLSADENQIFVAFVDAEFPNEGRMSVMTYDIVTSVDPTPVGNNSFDFYPNPASDFITITVQEEIEFIAVLSLEGKLIEKFQSKIIDLSTIPHGLYLLQVNTDKGVGYKRLVKN